MFVFIGPVPSCHASFLLITNLQIVVGLYLQ